ncbi:virion core protein-like protein [Seal parapoxvirus]|uniref:25 kDa core protein OPG138 n=1 Tax=Seal parapoxvirus TaxID=187984 RepID=A0A1Z3GCR9_9POXV|nr:virion core protein-like protein [Seal parapoxvirus]ASC55554.1 virion core protein-like protein [Seal parapoxvirus]
MADKTLVAAQRSQSSYDDYICTLNKIAPQLRSLLTHLNNEQVVRGGSSGDGEACAGGASALEAASSRRSASSKGRGYSSATKSSSLTSSRSRRSGAPPRREGGMRSCDIETVQAVSNCGKIVYGVVKNGKMEVQGTMGEVSEDLLGLECVNGGRKNKNASSSLSSKSKSASSGKKRVGGASSSSSAASRRRKSAASVSMNAIDVDGGMC